MRPTRHAAQNGVRAADTAFLSPERRPSMTAITADIPPPPVLTGKPAPEPVPTASAAPKRTNALAPAPPAWTSEAWLLDRARRAEAAEALALADQHAQRFPVSRRAAAREEIAVHALVRLGRRAEAEARAARLLQRAPQKRQAIESLLGEKLLCAVEHRAAEQPASHEAPSAEDLALEAEARALFLEAVEELRRSTPAQHAVLVLHLSGSSNVEIAAVLGLAEDTVGGRLRRARAAVTAFVRRRMAQDESYARRRSMRR